jgi:hypothetical protein
MTDKKSEKKGEEKKQLSKKECIDAVFGWIDRYGSILHFAC